VGFEMMLLTHTALRSVAAAGCASFLVKLPFSPQWYLILEPLCFVQYSRNFWLLENARNTQAYCEFFVFSSSVFFDVFRVLCGNTAKHSQNTRKTPAKHHKTPAKHHETPQNTFANKTAHIYIC